MIINSDFYILILDLKCSSEFITLFNCNNKDVVTLINNSTKYLQYEHNLVWNI